MAKTSGNLSGSQPLLESTGTEAWSCCLHTDLAPFHRLKANILLTGAMFLCIGPLRKRGEDFRFVGLQSGLVQGIELRRREQCTSSECPRTKQLVRYRGDHRRFSKQRLQCCSLSQRGIFFSSPSWPCGAGSTFTARQWWRPGLCLAAAIQRRHSMRH